MSDFKLVNIVDSQLEDITSTLTLPVITGASSNTYNTFPSQSGTGLSQIQFNVQIPSMATAVSRHFLMSATITLQLDIVGGTTASYWAANQSLFYYGQTNALQAFPLNSLLSTIQSAINSANVNVNTRAIMAAMLKLYNYEELAKYNSLTPSLVDSFYQNYADGLGSNNNVLSNYSTGSFAKEYQPRGCYVVSLSQLDGTPIPGLSISSDATGTSPYASFLLKFTVTEPLLFLSPYISGNSNNQAAFLGLNNLTLTLNIGDATRVMSNASYAKLAGTGGATVPTISNVSLSAITGAELQLQFFTIPPTLFAKIEPKNIVNYNQYSSFNFSNGSSIASKASQEFQMNSIQLNQVPSKIIVYAMKSQLTSYDSNFFLCIDKIGVNFCNKSALLSTAKPSQLYDMSVRNGLQMSYYEFSGAGVSNNSNGAGLVVPTIGSIVVIDPSIDLSIDPQYSNGSAGQYNLQITVTLRNQTGSQITPTLYCVVVNSGLFITENGISSTMTGLLTQEAVLETKSKDAVVDKMTYEKEIVGGSIENIGSIHKHLKLKFHNASEHENHLDNSSGEDAPMLGIHPSSAGAMAAAGFGGGAMAAAGRPKRLHRYTHR